MNNNKAVRIVLFVASIIVVSALFLVIKFSGNEKSPKREKLTISIDIAMIDDKYIINNNEVNVLYGDDVEFEKSDFYIIATFDDDSSLIIENNFEFSTNITQDVAVGEYRLEFKYKNLSKEIKVIINPVSLNNENIVINKIEDCEYTGIEINPSVSIKFKDNLLIEGEDYYLEYSNNINASNSAEIKILGRGNFEGSLTKTFSIIPKVLSVGDWVYTTPYVYNGNEFNVKLSNIANELNVEYINNKKINAGEYLAKAILTLKPEFDSRNYIIPTINDLEWEIKPKSLILASIVAEDIAVYNGSAIELEVKVSLGELILQKDIDYSVSYIDNINVTDNAKVVIIGKGNYNGEIYHTFKIIPQSISLSVEWDYPTDGYVYSGQVYEVKIKDIPSYLMVSYQNNCSSEANNYCAKAIFELKPEYRDNFILLNTEFTLNWCIKPMSILRCVVSEIPNQIYTGIEIKPNVVITNLLYNNDNKLNDKLVVLQEGVDYQVTYLNNINPGRATIVIDGIGNYSDRVIKSFNIEKKLD